MTAGMNKRCHCPRSDPLSLPALRHLVIAVLDTAISCIVIK